MVTTIGCVTVSFVNAYRVISNGFVLAIHHSPPPFTPLGPDSRLIENPGISIFIELAAKDAPDNINMAENQSAFILPSRTAGLSGAGPMTLKCKLNAPSRVRSRPLVRRSHRKYLQAAKAIDTAAATDVTTMVAIRLTDDNSCAVRTYRMLASGTLTAATHNVIVARVIVRLMGIKKSIG